MVAVASAYHSMPAWVCVAQVTGQSFLEERHAALSPVQHSKE